MGLLPVVGAVPRLKGEPDGLADDGVRWPSGGRPFLYNSSAYRDTRGNVLGVFAAARDVTRLIHAQREVDHQQARELERLAELERLHRMTVGRELKMIELKKGDRVSQEVSSSR